MTLRRSTRAFIERLERLSREGVGDEAAQRQDLEAELDRAATIAAAVDRARRPGGSAAVHRARAALSEPVEHEAQAGQPQVEPASTGRANDYTTTEVGGVVAQVRRRDKGPARTHHHFGRSAARPAAPAHILDTVTPQSQILYVPSQKGR